MVIIENGTAKHSNSRCVKVLMLGDQGVGKTSLIYSFANNKFKPKLPAKLADVTIPARATPDCPEKVTLRVIDYSSREQDEDQLKDSIRQADAICLVYILGDERSFKRVSSLWLPLIREYQTDTSTKTTEPAVYKPIILVANKNDLYCRKIMMREIDMVMREYFEIFSFFRSSTVDQRCMDRIFSKAQEAVLYPIAPLLEPRRRLPRYQLVAALKEIFKMCDIDGDGFLNRDELYFFQRRCFGTSSRIDTLDALDALKALRLTVKPDDVHLIKGDNITQSGFLLMHHIMLFDGHQDFIWRVLRGFDYDAGTDGKLVKLRSTHDSENKFDRDSSENIDSNGLRPRQETQTMDKYDTSAKRVYHPGLPLMKDHSGIARNGFGFMLDVILSLVAMRHLIHGKASSFFRS